MSQDNPHPDAAADPPTPAGPVSTESTLETILLLMTLASAEPAPRESVELLRALDVPHLCVLTLTSVNIAQSLMSALARVYDEPSEVFLQRIALQVASAFVG